MSQFLASVSNVREAKSVLSAGADIVDIKDPSKGPLGAVEYHEAKEIVHFIDYHCRTSATIGDLPVQPDELAKSIRKMAGTGVDIVKVGMFEENFSMSVIRALNKQAKYGIKIVIVLFADNDLQFNLFDQLARAGVHGIMLDTADKTKGSIRTILKDGKIDLFIKTAQKAGLMTGVAGSLSIRDVKPLLKMSPDYLGFRGALCYKSRRIEEIDELAVRRIRSIIPQDNCLNQNKPVQITL